MSSPREVDHALGWMFAEALLAEDEADRVEQLTEEEIEADMRAEGFDPKLVPTVEELLERAAARAVEHDRAVEAHDSHVVELAGRRHSRRILLLVAAMFALVVVVMVKEGPAIVALFKHDKEAPIGPDNEQSPPPTPEERAALLRNDATLACEDYRWVLCRDKLDEARALDPAGESSPSVKNERTAIQKGLYPPRDDKGMK